MEVVGQLHAEDQPDPPGHVAVAGEDEIDREGERHDHRPHRKRGHIEGGHPAQRAVELIDRVPDDHLFAEADKEEPAALPRPLQGHAHPLDLGHELVVVDERPGVEPGEKEVHQRERGQVVLGVGVAEIAVDHIAAGGERHHPEPEREMHAEDRAERPVEQEDRNALGRRADHDSPAQAGQPGGVLEQAAHQVVEQDDARQQEEVLPLAPPVEEDGKGEQDRRAPAHGADEADGDRQRQKEVEEGEAVEMHVRAPPFDGLGGVSGSPGRRGTPRGCRGR